MYCRTAVTGLFLTLFTLTTLQPAEAQLSRLRRAAEDATRREATHRVTTAIGEATACAISDTQCQETARANGETVVLVDEDGEVVTDENGTPIVDPDQATAATEEPGEGRWANYDFLRGERPIYNSRWNVEDTENPPAMKPNPSVRVGRIPGNVEFVSGNMEIVQIDGLNTAEFKDPTTFRIPLPEPLPEDFSLEFTLEMSTGSQYFFVYFQPFAGQGIDRNTWEHHYLYLMDESGIFLGRDRASGMTGVTAMVQGFTPIKFQVDDGYAILYVAGERIAQVPNFKHLVGSTAIEFEVHGHAPAPIHIRDIRVDYGVEDPVSVLEAEGEYTTRSIYFDFNSADLRPESTPELERLRGMIAEYGRPLVIEGHTDSTGPDDYNMELSTRRAEAVKAYLESKGIDAGLVQAVGKGETETIADNATDDGRQANRRVRVVVAAG